MPNRESKRKIICLSSDDDEEESDEEFDDEDDDEGDSEEEFDDEDDDEGDSEEEFDDKDDAEGESDEEFDNEDSSNDCDEVLSDRVIRFLKENKKLDSLKLNDCKAYLRENGLRIAGTKAVCIQRVKEHWRFDKVTRHGGLIGKRTVAGRVVKESYGASKQQHTFTVEVLWSRGVRQLPPLYPLLVKGRNLYKLRTFRQLWSDEAERVQVLAEKHKRGAAARGLRAMQKGKRKFRQTRGGAKDQRHVHLARQTLNSKGSPKRMPSRDKNNARRRHST